MQISDYRRRAPGMLGWMALLLALAGACSDAADPVDRDNGAADGDDDVADDDSAPDDDSDDDGAPDDDDDDQGVDAARPSQSKPDAGSRVDARVDAAKPVQTTDASRDVADAGDEPEPSADGGVAGDAAANDSGPSGEARADLGKGDGKDVVTIGDSWMLYITTGIQESLTKVSGQPYRKYARPGTRLLDNVIPEQYATAKRADPNIKTIVMTAGGNDIIQSSSLRTACMQGTAACDERVAMVHMRLGELWKEMSADGVQDIIHVMYTKHAGDGVKNREQHNENLSKVCAAVPPPLRCHLLNTDELIGPSDVRRDNIHPTDPGYDKIGKAVFDLMVEKGMRR